MLIGTFDTLQEAGCIQCEYESMRSLFFALMVATHRNPCTTGCPAFKDGKCHAYQLYHTDAKLQRAEDKKRERALGDATTPHNGTGSRAGLTMKQIAQEEGISLKEARRRKARGEYK